MRFHSGFSLVNEQKFFEPYLSLSEYAVCGFSYGAIKAFQEVKQMLYSQKRVDKLQLLSPAFFQTKSSKYKRLQRIGYQNSKEKYLAQFMQGCFAPYEALDVSRVETSIEELQELLEFEWSQSELYELEQQGVVVEVYLGGLDAIIDVQNAREFFTEVATLTYIKNANHFLQINKEIS